MKLFPVILAANLITLVTTIIAAIKFRSWSYQLIGLVALAAFLFAVYQFQSETYHPATLIFTAIAVFLIALRILINFWNYRKR